MQHLVYRTPTAKNKRPTSKPARSGPCPAGVPGLLRLEANSWFIVFERKRRPGEIDYFKWFCNSMWREKAHEASAEVGHYRADPVDRFFSDEKLRACKNVARYPCTPHAEGALYGNSRDFRSIKIVILSERRSCFLFCRPMR